MESSCRKVRMKSLRSYLIAYRYPFQPKQSKETRGKTKNSSNAQEPQTAVEKVQTEKLALQI